MPRVGREKMALNEEGGQDLLTLVLRLPREAVLGQEEKIVWASQLQEQWDEKESEYGEYWPSVDRKLSGWDGEPTGPTTVGGSDWQQEEEAG